MNVSKTKKAGAKGKSSAFAKAEPVAEAIREHQTAVGEWRYAELAGELHRWVEIFDSEFKLKLPSYPVIRFASIRNAYATYGWFRNELGTKDNITFNSNELDRHSGEILRTLCHELIHLWQHYHGRPSKSRKSYHNVEYREKALDCGLYVDSWGCTSGHTEAFTFVLAKHGVHLDPLPRERKLWGARKRSQKMLKWRCDCTTVRCATRLNAICQECGIYFHRG